MHHEIKKISNSHIRRILVGVPLNHKHLRALIELTDGTQLVLHEATLASIVRAFLTTQLNPIRDAIELMGTELVERREGFAEYQLLATEKCSSMVKKELTQAIT